MEICAVWKFVPYCDEESLWNQVAIWL